MFLLYNFDIVYNIGYNFYIWHHVMSHSNLVSRMSKGQFLCSGLSCFVLDFYDTEINLPYSGGLLVPADRCVGGV